MNALKLFSVCVALMFSVVAMAGNSPDKVSIKSLKSHLEKVDFTQYVSQETKVFISFMINDKSEIVIMSTSNRELDSVLKSAVNYKKIEGDDFESNKLYTLPLLIK